MRKYGVAFATALVAMFALASFASAAGATTIAISPGGPVTGSSAGTLTLTASTILGNINIACNPLTFGVSLNASTVAGSGDTAVGSVNSGSATGCGSGNAVSFSGMPWTINAVSPFATGTGVSRALSIQRATITASVFSGALSCNFSGNIGATLNAAGTSLAFSGSVAGTSGGLCPSSGSLNGSMGISPTQTVTVS